MTSGKSPQNSSREKLLKATEDLLREKGYTAITSRRVAEQAGLKPQLVHYHFRTMDDLLLEVYRRWATALIERQKTLLSSETPLRDMWKLTTDARGVLLNEFIALANHRQTLRAEIAELGDRFRRTQIDIMARILEKKGVNGFPWSPAFGAILLNALARTLALESEVGITEGHAEAREIIERFMDEVENQSVISN